MKIRIMKYNGFQLKHFKQDPKQKKKIIHSFLFLKEKPYFIDDMGEVVQELKRRKQVRSLQQLYNERKKLKRKKKKDYINLNLKKNRWIELENKID